VWSDVVAALEALQESRDQGGWVLQVAVHRDDGVGIAVIEAGQRRRLLASARRREDARGGLPGGDGADDLEVRSVRSTTNRTWKLQRSPTRVRTSSSSARTPR
jgi:hypothetical protein